MTVLIVKCLTLHITFMVYRCRCKAAVLIAIQYHMKVILNINSLAPGRFLGLKRYAQPTIRYDTWYDAHDTIRSAIHLSFLPRKQRLVIPACDQKHCNPLTITACAVMMRSGYNNGGLLGVSRCSVFVMNSLILLEYTFYVVSRVRF